MPRRKSRLLRTTTKNGDQTMGENSGVEAKVPKEETKTTLLIGLREIPPLLIRTSLSDQTSNMGTAIRIMGDHMFNAHINHSREAMETDLEKDLSTIRMGTGETMEDCLAPHRLQEATSQKRVRTANQELISLTILPFVDLTINLRLVLRLLNKNFNKAITRRLIK